MNQSFGKIAPLPERSSRPSLVSEASPNPTALVVLGMHRSGTSALTRVLSLSGYALPSTLMDPSTDNSEGFWESRPIADLNDELLSLIGSYWDDCFGFSPDTRNSAVLAGHRQRAIDLVHDQFPGTYPIVLKDPRIAVIYDFWREVLAEAGYSVSPVIAVRHPLEVSASLSKRNGFPANKSLLVWLSYQLAAERATRDRPRAVVMYDDLMSDWRSCLDRLEKSLGIFVGRRDPEAALLIERFLKQDLRHHTVDDQRESTRRALPSFIGATYDWFKSTATGVDVDPSVLVAPTEEYVRQRRWFGPIVADLRLEALAMRRRVDEEIHKADTRFLAAAAAYGAEIDTRDLELRRQSQALVEADEAAMALQRSASILDERLREAERSASQRIAELEAQVLEIERVRASQHEQYDRETTELHLRLGKASEAQLLAAADIAALETQLRERESSSAQRIAEQIAQHRESSAKTIAAYEAERERREAEVRAERHNAQDVIAGLQADLSRTQGIAHERGQLLHRLERENHDIRSSTLWGFLQPARWLGQKIPQLSKTSRGLRSAARTLLRGPAPEPAQPAVPAYQAVDATLTSGSALRKSVNPEPIAQYLAAEQFDLEPIDLWRLHCTRFPLPIDPGSQEKPNVALSDIEADEWVRRCCASGAGLSPLSGAPDVSIIIPVYNQLAFTLSAIASVYALKTKYTYEILIGDDDSSDQTRLLDDSSLPRVRVVRHSGNVGFLLNCNRAAEQARGTFVVLLNNDTVVLPGWLDELIDTLKSDENIGLVGSKLLYANATLQEAGGIVWQDGSAWNWGRNQDPRDPRYCYAREVDYCSGASIAMSSGLWRRLGGFDGVTFENSYYEDVDLAFRVREAGLKVVYQPLSSIVHFEGITSGVDVKGGAKKYQVSNGAKFLARWRQTLKTHRPNAVEPVKESERHVKGRLLIIDLVTPTPDRDGGSFVMMEMISAFQASGWRVSFIPADNFAHLPVVTHRLQRNGVEALYWPHFQSVDEILEKRGAEFDIVVISRMETAARHLNVVRARAPHAKIIFNTVDLHFLREQREAELSGNADALQKAEKTKALELQAVSGSDLTIVHSTVERDILDKERPEAKVALFPWVSSVLPPSVPLSSRDSILFVGGFRHAPNADGLRWFLDAIWPRVRAQVRQAKFNIVGPDAPEDIRNWHGRDGVSVLGWVENLDPQLNRARVSVAPLRFGAGLKGKVVLALSRGLPVVCTSIASEGMGLRSGVDVLVADDPEEFARAIVTLLNDETAWLQLSRNGLCFVEDNYSYEAARNRVKAMVNMIGL